MQDACLWAWRTLFDSFNSLSMASKIQNYVISNQWAAEGTIIKAQIIVKTKNIHRIETSLQSQCIIVGSTEWYFLPDMIYIFQSGNCETLSYHAVEVTTEFVEAIEEANVGQDAKVLSVFWKHTTKSGQPDRRYSVNPQYYRVQYVKLVIGVNGNHSTSLNLYISSEDRARSFRENLTRYINRLWPNIKSVPLHKTASGTVPNPSRSKDSSTVHASEPSIVDTNSMPTISARVKTKSSYSIPSPTLPSTDTRTPIQIRSVTPQVTTPQSLIPARKVNRGVTAWYGTNQSLSIHGFTVSDPLVYFGYEISESGREEPSLINPDLRVDNVCVAEHLPYFPDYNTMSPQQRWTYLDWLCKGKRGDIDPGYLHVFLYGVERRVVEVRSNKRRDDLREAIGAIDILTECYPNYKSFQSYSKNLIMSQWNMCPDHIRFDFSDAELQIVPTVTVLDWGLACLATSARKFTRRHAIQWLTSKKRSVQERVVGQRCWDEIVLSVTQSISGFIGDGIRLCPRENLVNISVGLSNISLDGRTLTSEAFRCNEGTQIREELNSILVRTTESLSPRSFFLGRNPSEEIVQRADLLLPHTLWKCSGTARKLTETLNECSSSQVPVKLTSVLEKANLGKSPLGKLHAHLFEQIRHLGFIVEPDSRFNHVQQSEVSSIVVMKQVDDSCDTPSEKMKHALQTVFNASQRLESKSKFEGTLSNRCIEVIGKFFDLNMNENRRLCAYYLWCKHHTVNHNTSRLPSISKDYPARVTECLKMVIHITTAELDSSKTYRAQHVIVKPNQIDGSNQIHATRGAPNKPSNPFSIPPRPFIDVEETKSISSTLDLEKVKLIQNDTKQVRDILSPILGETDTDIITTTKSSKIDPLDIINSLPASLSGDSLTLLASDFAVSYNELRELVNEYAYAKCDSPLFIGNDPYEIDPEILKELRFSQL